MTGYLLLRLLKFVALAVFAGGIMSSVVSVDRDARMRALGAATVGFVVTWTAGYGLMKFTDRALSQPWILWGLAASMVAFHMAALVAHKANPRPISALLAVAGLLSSIGVMSLRTDNVWAMALVTIGACLIAAPMVRFWVPDADKVEGADPEASWRWFKWIARIEGLSLVVLVLVSMPLRKGLGISLDGGTGTLGWVHGALFVVYLQALMSTGRKLGWGGGRFFQGAILSVIPFGAVFFERLAKPVAAGAEKRA